LTAGLNLSGKWKGGEKIMCLDTIDQKKGNFRQGYKVGVNLAPARNGFGTAVMSTILPMREWIKDSKPETERIEAYLRESLFHLGSSYRPGFHLYQTLKEARQAILNMGNNNLSIARCKVRRITATGRQDGLRVIVAREIFIERIIE
jgi:hypothetical protein